MKADGYYRIPVTEEGRIYVPDNAYPSFRSGIKEEKCLKQLQGKGCVHIRNERNLTG